MAKVLVELVADSTVIGGGFEETRGSWSVNSDSKLQAVGSSPASPGYE